MPILPLSQLNAAPLSIPADNDFDRFPGLEWVNPLESK
jgi:hypothetical protein